MTLRKWITFASAAAMLASVGACKAADHRSNGISVTADHIDGLKDRTVEALTVPEESCEGRSHRGDPRSFRCWLKAP